MVFQDPMTSLNPTMTIGKQIMEGMIYHYHIPKKEAYEKADAMIKDMQNKAAALVKKLQSEETKKDDAKSVQKSLNMLRTNLGKEKDENVEQKPKVARKI